MYSRGVLLHLAATKPTLIITDGGLSACFVTGVGIQMNKLSNGIESDNKQPNPRRSHNRWGMIVDFIFKFPYLSLINIKLTDRN